jgi:pyrroline-5-carboxylate reductase
MAEALIKGMTSHGMRDIIVSEPREERRRYLEESYGVMTTQLNKPVASSAGIIILAVKPQNMTAVLEEIADVITDEKTVVSIAAGITLSYLESKLRTKRLVRVMPNTPAIVQEGMSVMSLCECFSDGDIAAIREIFMSVGTVLVLPEKHMNAVTALSGSGPAFIALFVEAMINAGGRMGLNRENAGALAVQTLVGTAKLLDTGMSPERLREMVTSPGGTTAAGLKVFEEEDLFGIVGEALQAAVKRAGELGGKE